MMAISNNKLVETSSREIDILSLPLGGHLDILQYSHRTLGSVV